MSARPGKVALAFLLATAAALGTGCGERAPNVPTLRLARADFRHEVAAEGVLEARRATPLTAPSETDEGMRLAELLPDGSPVAAGDVVARFDTAEWQRQLADAESDLSAAGSKRSKHGAGATATERNLERDAVLAATERAAAERFQAKDELVFSRLERIESAIDAELAGEREANARRVLATQKRLSTSDGRLIALEENKATLAVDRATKGLSAVAVSAPHAGIFTLVADWRGNVIRLGDTLWPGQPFGEIPDLSILDAEVFVLEADAGGLAVGQRAAVVREAEPGRAIAAEVTRVDAVAKPRQRNVPVQYFGATLALAAHDFAGFAPGERVRARIVVAAEDAALAVPRQALFDRDGKKVVYRFERARFVPVAVEIGAQGLGLAVVRAGLVEGDLVALADPTSAPRPATAPAGAGDTNDAPSAVPGARR